MSKKILALIIVISFILSGCSTMNQKNVVAFKMSETKGATVYQNKAIYGFKVAPDGKKMLVVIDNAIVIYDLEKMKPSLKFAEEGLISTPTNILWAPDSKMATVIFTGNINRMIFIDLAKKGQIHDLYAKNLIDLAWSDNENLFYKVNDESEAIFKLKVFSKEPELLTALRPGEIQSIKMLLVNGYNGFILKKDDTFTAVNADNLDKPQEIANLNFRESKGILTRSVILEDKNENGILLRKYGFLKIKDKSFIMNNSLVFLDVKGQTISPIGIEGRMLGKGLAIRKENGAVLFFDLKDSSEKQLPGKWTNYQYRLQSDYWQGKEAVLLKEKARKNNKNIDTINIYKLSK